MSNTEHTSIKEDQPDTFGLKAGHDILKKGKGLEIAHDLLSMKAIQGLVSGEQGYVITHKQVEDIVTIVHHLQYQYAKPIVDALYGLPQLADYDIAVQINEDGELDKTFHMEKEFLMQLAEADKLEKENQKMSKISVKQNDQAIKNLQEQNKKLIEVNTELHKKLDENLKQHESDVRMLQQANKILIEKIEKFEHPLLSIPETQTDNEQKDTAS